MTKSNVSYKEYGICVITAANNHQAKGYQEQLRWRKDLIFTHNFRVGYDIISLL